MALKSASPKKKPMFQDQNIIHQEYFACSELNFCSWYCFNTYMYMYIKCCFELVCLHPTRHNRLFQIERIEAWIDSARKHKSTSLKSSGAIDHGEGVILAVSENTWLGFLKSGEWRIHVFKCRKLHVLAGWLLIMLGMRILENGYWKPANDEDC